MKHSAHIWLLGLLATVSFAGETGLTGFPANIYDPYCATACLRSLNGMTLDCSSEGVTVGMVTFQTSTECYAQNTPFLTSVAWCVHTKCAAHHPSASLLEYWWDMQVTGQKAAGVEAVPAKWTYGETLAHVTEAPTLQLSATDTVLNTTSLVAPSTYEMQYNVLYGVQREGTVENGYGIAILVTGFATPILLTWLGYVPFISTLIHKLKPYLVWPSTIGTYHIRPLPYLLGNAPTIGQSLYIALFIILNIILTSVNYESRQPNAWYATRWREIVAFVLYRTGNFAYIMAPLVFLFAGRNNILLCKYLTNWPHSTCILLHRWVARVFTFQALLHSVLALVLYCEEGMYDMEHTKPYWIWGIVATVCTVVLCFFSGLYIRAFFYEAWLLVHIVLSVIVVVACWYHAYDLYAYLGGYCYWLYAVSAVWAFDRAARIARLLHTGPRRAVVTELGGNGNGEAAYVRVDIPGVRWGLEPGNHAYFYFPTLHPLRPWENHPFSLLPTALLGQSHYDLGKTADRNSIEDEDHSSTDQTQIQQIQIHDDADVHAHASPDADPEKNKHGAITVTARTHIRLTKVVRDGPRPCPHPAATATAAATGLTLFIRKGKGKGMTNLLRADQSLLTFIEGPYANNSLATAQVLRCDRLLLIAGGIGITAIVPFVANHRNAKLAWSLKASAKCLVDELLGVNSVNGVNNASSVLGTLADGDREVSIGKRLDVARLLAAEVDAGWQSVGVVVSGPGSLCDHVRAAVVAAAKQSPKTVFELEVEAYSW